MTGPGTPWLLPGGHEAVEMEGSTRTVLRVAIRKPNWPFLLPTQEVARSLCKRMPSRYLRETLDDVGDALL